MPAPYTALTYGDPPKAPWSLVNSGYLSQNYPWWMGGFAFGNGTQYAAYSETFTAGGDRPLTISVQSGSLPTGLSLSDSGVFPGQLYTISGVPTDPGTFTFTLRATNANGYMDRQFTITIGLVSNSPPYWPSATFAGGTVGVSYTQQFTPNGNTPITVAVQSGSLPTGLSLSLVSGSTYQISGTPTATGTFSFTLRATNAYGTADQAFSITIGAGGDLSYTFVS